MNFYIMTLFPDMVMQGLNTSIIGRAAEKGLLTIEAVNIRDYTINKHKKVDDYPYGGGAGMLMQAQPVYDAWRSIVDKIGTKPRTIYLTPQGPTFTQQAAKSFAKEENLIFLCGHYEGIDERVLEEIVTDYVSIGDYVLTGGELPAMVMVDAFCMVILTAGLIYATSAVTVFFRDMKEVVSILLQIGMWVTPIMWNFESMQGIPKWAVLLLKLNPMYYIVSGYRDALINKTAFWEYPGLTLWFWGITLFILWAGTTMFKRLRVHFADVL